MRIPIPERFPAKYVIVFAVGLFLAEVLEGTDFTFALLVFIYVLLFGAGFNLSGGITYPSGAWIFFTGTLTCLVGITYKAFLRQPAESHFRAPLTTMASYCCSMAGMTLAAYVCRSMRPKKGLLTDVAVGQKMNQAAIGCLVLGVAGTFAVSGSVTQLATLSTAFAQLNHFVQMAIILGTTYQISHSKGKSSTNWIVWTAGLFLFVFGLISYSKEGMFIAFLSWIVPCIVMRFDFSIRQVVGGVLFALFALYYLVPYSQYGRRSRGEVTTFSVQLATATDYLLNLNETRALYLEAPDVADITGQPHLYDKSEGLFDRLQMLSFDDALIDYTMTTETIGLGPTGNSFLNTIPRFIWENKPVYGQGNLYGRELGVLADDDVTTGISFSAVGDAYHQAAWLGVAFVLPLVVLMMFLIADSLSGDVRQAPWGLLFIAMSAHQAPEGLLVGVVWMATFGAEILIFVAFLSAYILPRIVALASGGERTRVRLTRDFRLGPQNRKIASNLGQSGPKSTTV